MEQKFCLSDKQEPTFLHPAVARSAGGAIDGLQTLMAGGKDLQALAAEAGGRAGPPRGQKRPG